MEEENLLVPNIQNNEEERSELSLRPKTLNEYIGQNKVKENMKVYIEAAKKRGEPLDHVLLYGPPGLGKTTLANIIAMEMNSNIRITSGPAIEKPWDLAALLTNLSPNDVLFIDEIESALHPKAICEFLDMISYISHDMGIQVFISTHSYFVIKKLFLIALKHPGEVACISLAKGKEPQICDLSEGMPENSIIQASIDLYKQEVAEVLWWEWL